MADVQFDIRERCYDPDEVLETVRDGVVARLPKAGPVRLSEDSEDGNTAKLQPAVKGIQRKIDGTTEAVALPEIPDVPVYFASGNKITTTYGQKKGQEGWMVPAALGIDGWHQN